MTAAGHTFRLVNQTLHERGQPPLSGKERVQVLELLMSEQGAPTVAYLVEMVVLARAQTLVRSRSNG